VFFVNIPLGLIALFVTGVALPDFKKRVSHVIDYLGSVMLTVSASAFVLFTSLGGNTISWGSGWSITLLSIGLVTGLVFVSVELRAVEPVLAPRIMKQRVVASASAIGFVVGFAMYGAMTFLPYYFQTVRGVSPTMSGLRLLPLMAGLFTMSTSSWLMAFYMTVLGIGLGLVMQILVVAVQNAVELKDLGSATAAANFFRSIGGSFGTAVFGALFTNVLPHQLHRNLAALHVSTALPPSSSWTPKILHLLPPRVLHAILESISSAIHTVFRYAMPVGILAFLLSLTLPNLKLRGHAGADEAPPAFQE
jgi:hypothetical protein